MLEHPQGMHVFTAYRGQHVCPTVQWIICLVPLWFSVSFHCHHWQSMQCNAMPCRQISNKCKSMSCLGLAKTALGTYVKVVNCGVVYLFFFLTHHVCDVLVTVWGPWPYRHDIPPPLKKKARVEFKRILTLLIPSGILALKQALNISVRVSWFHQK